MGGMIDLGGSELWVLKEISEDLFRLTCVLVFALPFFFNTTTEKGLVS